MKKITQFIFFVALSLVATFVACNQGGGNGGDSGALPELELVYIKINGIEIDKTKLKNENWDPIIVEHAKVKFAQGEITARFDYGKEKNKTLAVSVLETRDWVVGDNKLTLSVPALDKTYKGWTHKLVVRRKAAQEGGGVNFKMTSIKIKTQATPETWKQATKGQDDKWQIEVPNSMTQIAKEDIKAYFEWDNMPPPKPKELEFSVEGNFPIQLVDPPAEKTVKITVPESQGVYPKFEATIVIKRTNLADLQLEKIKLVGSFLYKTGNPPKDEAYKKEIKGLELKNKKEYVESKKLVDQSLNVFFYSSVDAQQEDEDFLKGIDTEPKLEKKGKVKVWKLNAKDNELKIKKGGEIIYTIKVTRAPIEIDVISLSTLKDNVFNSITENAEAGQSYNSYEAEITISVLAKSGIEYKKMTAQVGNEAAVDLKQKTPGDITSPYEGKVTLQGTSANQITVKAIDPSGVDELNFVRTFNVTKLDENPNAGPINPAVEIKALYVGDGSMDKAGTNKFTATKVQGDEHKYTVNVQKSYKDEKVSLIVEGGDSAKDATIKDLDGATAGTVKANGTSVFTSAKSYFDVKSNSKKYLFTLENAGKKANYEITVIFDVVPQRTITVTQPQNGTIKVYTYHFKNRRKDLSLVDEGGKKIVKVGDGQTVFFELVADQGKTPTKLVVDGTEHTTVTNFGHQTAGAIAVRYQCKKDIEVSGECSQ